MKIALRIEIVCTGDEILTGKTVNTNYSHMARRLDEVGLPVAWGTTVGDDRKSLLSAFRQAAGRADAVIVNGGLGPTVDDLSQEVAAEVMGVELVLHQAWLDRIKDYFISRGREMPLTNRKQAMLPAGSEVIDNPIGTACGFALTIKKSRFFFTPGVPREMHAMLDQQIIPRLLEMSGSKAATRLKRFHTFGIGESRADQLLDGLVELSSTSPVKLGFQSHYPQLETKLAVRAANAAELEAGLAPVEAAVRARLGNFIVAEDEQTLEQRILDALGGIDGSLATMETFTAGGIAARLLPASGQSDLNKIGVVSRNLTQLADAVGIDPGALAGESYTATALALAEGLRRRSGCSHALVVLVSLDEEAGRTELDGRICVAIVDGSGSISRPVRLRGSRSWIRLGAIELGLDCLRRYLCGLPVEQKIDFEQ